MSSLARALAGAVEAALQQAADKVVRADVPSTWPVKEAIAAGVAQHGKERVRYGLLPPFHSLRVSGVRTSSDAEEMTRWRNRRQRSYALVMFGRASGRNTAGLKDLSGIVRAKDVIRLWRGEVSGSLAVATGKPEANSLAEAILDECERGRLDAVRVCDFLEGLLVADNATIDTVFQGMWRAGLMPDDQALDRGGARRRIALNLDTLARLDAADDTKVAARLQGAASGGATRKAASAQAILAYLEERDVELLANAWLPDIVAVLGEASAEPKAERPRDLWDLLDANGSHAADVGRILKQWAAAYPLSDPEGGVLNGDLFNEGGQVKYRLALQPRAETIQVGDGDEPEYVQSHLWTGDKVYEQPLVAVTKSREPREYDGTGPWVTFDGVRLRDTLETISDDVSKPVAALAELLQARSALWQYEPWLHETLFELLLLRDDAREAVHYYLAAWRKFAGAVTALQEAAGIVEFVQAMDAAWGPEAEEPTWCVLGPLHPYRLEPPLLVADFVVAALDDAAGPSELGKAARWLLDRCSPSYPAIYNKTDTLHLAGRIGASFEYTVVPENRLPTAEAGVGLSQVIKALVGFSPNMAYGGVVTIIDPPRGAAVQSDLRRVAQLMGGDVRFNVISTRSDANSLDDADLNIRQMGRHSTLDAVIEAGVLRSHVLVRFYPEPKGATAARQGWEATSGAFLAPYLSLDPAPLASTGPVAVPVVRIEPRGEQSAVAIVQTLFRRQTGSSPKHFQYRPMLPPDEEVVLRRMASEADWIICAAPGPLGLASPAMINSILHYVGRADLGPYSLYVYATDKLFAVRRYVEHATRDNPVHVEPAQLVDRISTLAKRSGVAILRMGSDGVSQHQAALTALEVSSGDQDAADYQTLILRIDDLGWVSAWLPRSLRCDYLVVKIALGNKTPRVKFKAVESKGVQSASPVTVSSTDAYFSEGVKQVAATITALRDVCVPKTTTLDTDLRFATLVEHLMAALLATDPDFDNIQRIRSAADTLNAFSAREIKPTELMFEGSVVVTQPGTNADRGQGRSDLPDGTPIKLIRATAKDVSALFRTPPDTRSGHEERALLHKRDAFERDEKQREQHVNQGNGSGADVRNTSRQASRPARKSPEMQEGIIDEDVDKEWAKDIGLDLIAVCREHGIPIESDEPVRLTIGPSLVGVSLRLRMGAQLGAIERRLDDIMRDLGMGERSREVSVANDLEPSAIRFLIPRKTRVYPHLPAEELSPVLDGEYLPIWIGQTLDGGDYHSCVESWPHMLVGGTSGSGKTTFLRTVISQCGRFGRRAVQMIVVDGKGDTDYLNLLPQESFVPEFPQVLLGHEHALHVVNWAIEEMERRKQALHKVARSAGVLGPTKWADVYRDSLAQGESPEIVPVVIVIDEFVDIGMAARSEADEFHDAVQRIVQMGRSRMIHLVLATQRPDKASIRGAIKTNLDTRVALRLPTPADSATILGHGGAERLLMKGDMLFRSGAQQIARLQAYSI